MMATPDQDLTQVLEVNANFYRAFESLDIQRMAVVSARADHVRCVHPGRSLLSGWEAVKASWELIFSNTKEIRFTLTDVRVQIRGTMAWVVLTENLLSQVQQDVTATSILATNFYEKTNGIWQMVHHHASHVFSSRTASDKEVTH
ncbi:MAG: nuclear transport factor 2 family protein [candidate division NC10 bacterium]